MRKKIDNDSTFCTYCGTKQNVEHKEDLTPVTKSHQPEFNKPSLESTIKQTKFDLSYKREEDALMGGIIFLIITIVLTIVGPIKFENSENNCLLSLPIYEKHTNGFLLQCYDNGCINKVFVKSILCKSLGFHYSNGKNTNAQILYLKLIEEDSIIGFKNKKRK